MDFWTYVILLVVSSVISYALMPKPAVKEPEAMKDIDFPQADEGTPQAVIFGDCWSGDWVVLAVGNYRTEEIRSESGSKK